MNRRICSFLTAMSLWITGTFPHYASAANSCDDMFDFSREGQYRDLLETVIRKHYDIPHETSLVAELFLMYGLRRLKLSGMESKFDMGQAIVESEHVFQVAHRFANNFEKSYETSSMQWARRHILSRGIEPLVNEYFVAKDRPRILKLINRILDNRLVSFAMNLRRLPYFSDRVISPGLQAKIVRDGPEAHQKAIEDAYSQTGQNVVQGYRQVSSIYASFFIVLLSYTAWQSLHSVDDEINEKRVAKLIDGLEDLAKLVEETDREMQRRGLYDLKTPAK